AVPDDLSIGVDAVSCRENPSGVDRNEIVEVDRMPGTVVVVQERMRVAIGGRVGAADDEIAVIPSAGRQFRAVQAAKISDACAVPEPTTWPEALMAVTAVKSRPSVRKSLTVY